MQYLGGKARIAEHIVPIILESRPKTVVEPFCGSLWVSVELLKQDPNLVVYASDAHKDLVDMWIAVQQGWTPPVTLSEEEYIQLKNASSSPLRTFAGYGCSYGGKWFGGYARRPSLNSNFAKIAHGSVMRKAKYLDRVVFSYGDYRDAGPGDVVYCDPPYLGTTKPGTANYFNHEEFWVWVRQQKVPVYTSEFQAPEDFSVVWEKEINLTMHATKTGSARVDRLFVKKR